MPRLWIYNKCEEMFSDGKSVEEAAALIEKFLRIVYITKPERNYLDHTLGLKQTMPLGWDFETGDVYARLRVANIRLTLLNGEMG